MYNTLYMFVHSNMSYLSHFLKHFLLKRQNLWKILPVDTFNKDLKLNTSIMNRTYLYTFIVIDEDKKVYGIITVDNY